MARRTKDTTGSEVSFLRKKIDELRDAKRKFEELHKEYGTFEDVKAKLKTLEDAIRVIEGETLTFKEIELKEGSHPYLAREALKKADEPLTRSELYEKVSKMTDKEIDKSSFLSTIHKYVKEGKVFKNLGPGRFGLLDMDYTEKKGKTRAVL